MNLCGSQTNWIFAGLSLQSLKGNHWPGLDDSFAYQFYLSLRHPLFTGALWTIKVITGLIKVFPEPSLLRAVLGSCAETGWGWLMVHSPTQHAYLARASFCNVNAIRIFPSFECEYFLFFFGNWRSICWLTMEQAPNCKLNTKLCVNFNREAL